MSEHEWIHDASCAECGAEARRHVFPAHELEPLEGGLIDKFGVLWPTCRRCGRCHGPLLAVLEETEAMRETAEPAPQLTDEELCLVCGLPSRSHRPGKHRFTPPEMCFTDEEVAVLRGYGDSKVFVTASRIVAMAERIERLRQSVDFAYGRVHALGDEIAAHRCTEEEAQ